LGGIRSFKHRASNIYCLFNGSLGFNLLILRALALFAIANHYLLDSLCNITRLGSSDHTSRSSDIKTYILRSRFNSVGMARGKIAGGTVIAFIVLWLSVWSLRPIVDYYFDSPPHSYNSHLGYLQLNLVVQNRGQTDTFLYLVVIVTHCEVVYDKSLSWVMGTSTGVKLYISAQRLMETKRNFSINIMPVGNPRSFTISYAIEQASPWLTAWGFISNMFLEQHGLNPITLVYGTTDMVVYNLVYQA
jgi:hypothetical protein